MPPQILTSPEVWGSKLVMSYMGDALSGRAKPRRFIRYLLLPLIQWSKFEVAWHQLVQPLNFFLKNSKFLQILPGHACVLLFVNVHCENVLLIQK
jgi:hypothetical protein